VSRSSEDLALLNANYCSVPRRSGVCRFWFGEKQIFPSSGTRLSDALLFARVKLKLELCITSQWRLTPCCWQNSRIFKGTVDLRLSHSEVFIKWTYPLGYEVSIKSFCTIRTSSAHGSSLKWHWGSLGLFWGLLCVVSLTTWHRDTLYWVIFCVVMHVTFSQKFGLTWNWLPCVSKLDELKFYLH